MEEQVFNFLVNRLASKIIYNAMVRDAPNFDVQEYNRALIGLCSKGLIKIETISGRGDFIIKQDEFYNAQALGWEQWNFVYNRDKARLENAAKWNQVYYKYRAKAAEYWWVSIPLSLLALGISIIKKF